MPSSSPPSRKLAKFPRGRGRVLASSRGRGSPCFLSREEDPGGCSAFPGGAGPGGCTGRSVCFMLFVVRTSSGLTADDGPRTSPEDVVGTDDVVGTTGWECYPRIGDCIPPHITIMTLQFFPKPRTSSRIFPRSFLQLSAFPPQLPYEETHQRILVVNFAPSHDGGRDKTGQG